MAALSLRGISKTLGANPILRDVSLEVRDGELAVLVGPSGCGKSTLLRTVAGLEEPDAGTLHIAGRDVTRAPPRDRDVAMVFQSYALYPHLTVRDNLAFGLRLRGERPAAIAERVAEVSRMLGLEALLERRPRALSGGQRQRVAMGRAIARRPSLFLFDEPLSNLDAALRTQVRIEIKRLHARLGATMLYVTHDQVEAMTLADRLVVLNAGAVEQVGPALEVYRRPATRFVAAFLGSPAMNFLPARVAEGGSHCLADGLRAPVDRTRYPTPGPDGRELLVGIRPHDLSPLELTPPHQRALPGDASNPPPRAVDLHVDVVEAMGFEAFAHGTVGRVPFVARLDGAAALPRPGDHLALALPAGSVHLFDPASGRALDAAP